MEIDVVEAQVLCAYCKTWQKAREIFFGEDYIGASCRVCGVVMDYDLERRKSPTDASSVNEQDRVDGQSGIWSGCGHKVKAIILDGNILSLTCHLEYLENNPKDLCHECWEADQ